MPKITATLNLELNVDGTDRPKIELGKLILDLSQLLNLFPASEQPDSVCDQILLTTEELATYLKKSPSCIRNWKRDGLIPYQRCNRSIFFNLEDVKTAIKKFDATKAKKIVVIKTGKSPPRSD